MNGIDIYYFSGTGNSLAVGRKLAGRLDAELIQIVSADASAAAETVGLVFPLYDFKPPEPVRAFIKILEGLEHRYIFAVCTYGIAAHHALTNLNEELKTRGGRLSGGFAVPMPFNAIGSEAVTDGERARLLSGWKERIGEICSYVERRESGTIESGGLFGGLFRMQTVRMLPTLIAFFSRLLIRGADSFAFTAEEGCDGCGVCAGICPVGNIEIRDGLPAWHECCLGCFACLHWCPRQAISLGGTRMHIRSYHHPDVKLSDMMRRTEV
jgi:ferredoxin/flavodoxin